MASKYYTQFLKYLQTTFASGLTPILGIAKKNIVNNKINFQKMPVPGKSGGATSDPQYAIQRRIYIKPKDTKEDHSAKYGTNLLARYDDAQRIAWDTITVSHAVKKDLLIELAKNEEFEIEGDGSTAWQEIKDTAQVIMIDQEQAVLQQLWDEVNTQAGAALPVLTYDGTVAKSEIVVETIYKVVLRLQMFKDKYKYMSNTIAVAIHPLIAKAFSDVQGRSYYNGTNTFPKGLGNSFTYMGIEFYVMKNLNTLTAQHGGKGQAAAIIFDTETLAVQPMNADLTEINEVHLDTRLIGHSYTEMSCVVDKARLAGFTFEDPDIPATDKVAA